MFTRTIHQKPTHKKYSSSNNFKKYNRIIHYFNLTENTKNKYSIRIYYNENMKGFGDGLNNIILNYSSNMFPKPSKFNHIGSIKQDLRPQKLSQIYQIIIIYYQLLSIILMVIWMDLLKVCY